MGDTPVFNSLNFLGANRILNLPEPVDLDEPLRLRDQSSGPTGPTGVTGPQGDDGATGTAGVDGTTGVTGPAGSNGADGATGATGVTGTAGVDGVTGVTGSLGLQGVTGVTGAGTQGITGVTGPAGSAGTDGVTGVTGATGASGAGGGGGGDPATLDTLGVVVFANAEETEQGAVEQETGKPFTVNPTNLLLRRTTQNALIARPQAPLESSSSSSLTSGIPEIVPAGNARGIYAVDLQSWIELPTQVASGARAVCIGSRQTASGDNDVCIGTHGAFPANVASGGYSLACGTGNNLAAGYISSAVGYGNRALGARAVTFGDYNYIEAVSGYCAAMGRANYCRNASFMAAIGVNNNATSAGGFSVAMGGSNTAGPYGPSNSSVGRQNYTGGVSTGSSGRNCAFGFNNRANGKHGNAFGSYNHTNVSSVAMGILNNSTGTISASTTSPIVSGGTTPILSIASRSVAVGMRNQCHTLAYSQQNAIGSFNYVNSYRGSAIGRANNVYQGVGGFGLAMGHGNTTTGYSFAIGGYNRAYEQSLCIGRNCLSYGVGTAAFGYVCTVDSAVTFAAVCGGYICYVGGNYCTAIGVRARAGAGITPGTKASSFGYLVEANGSNSLAMGHLVYCDDSAVSSIGIGVLVNRSGYTISDITGVITVNGAAVANGINSTTLGVGVRNLGRNATLIGRAGYISAAGIDASLIGRGHSVSATGGSCLGGITGSVTGNYGTTVGGRVNTASGVDSIAMGNNSTATRTGELVHNSLDFLDDTASTRTGERGYHRITGNVKTGNATVTTVASVLLEAGTACVFEIVVIGNQSAGAHRASYKRRVTVYRVAAGVATIEGSVETIGTDIESDITWDLTVDVDGTNTMRVRVTGVAATDINWGASVKWVGIGEVVN